MNLADNPKRFIMPLAFALLAALVAASFTTSRAAKNGNAKLVAIATQAYQVSMEAKSLAEFGDRVIDLPEDGNLWHTTVFTSETPTPEEHRVLSWFDSNTSLQSLKKQTHFHHYTPKSSVFERYTSLVANGYPAVVLQDGTGKVIYKASGANVPQSDWPLVKGIIECIRSHCPHCPRPNPTPTPSPVPTPSPNPIPDIGPHVVPDVVGPNDNTPPNGKDDTIPVTVAVFVIFLVVGFVVAAKNNGRASVSF